MNIRTLVIGGGLAAASLVGGAVGASIINGTAGAQTTTSTAPSTTAPALVYANRAALPEHGTPEHEGLEKPVTGDSATKAQDAAVKSLGSGTAGDVTTDATGDG